MEEKARQFYAFWLAGYCCSSIFESLNMRQWPLGLLFEAEKVKEKAYLGLFFVLLLLFAVFCVRRAHIRCFLNYPCANCRVFGWFRCVWRVCGCFFVIFLLF